MTNYDTGRTWSNAPSGVRSARALAWLATIITGFMLIFAVCMLVSGELLKMGIAGVLVFGLYSVFFPFYVWLLVGLKRGTPAAYWVQLVIAVIGLVGFPIGTLIYAYILYLWFKPETKAWFGV
jgi:hypothetical protein